VDNNGSTPIISPEASVQSVWGLAPVILRGKKDINEMVVGMVPLFSEMQKASSMSSALLLFFHQLC